CGELKGCSLRCAALGERGATQAIAYVEARGNWGLLRQPHIWRRAANEALLYSHCVAVFGSAAIAERGAG
ncbi:MAG: hypothetical protein K1Y02_21880, partial [Candidatus Hydrogenedentes bacterium]|nr:hypothetical protein [Candidatus Hydrogenedentota bacterium]